MPAMPLRSLSQFSSHHPYCWDSFQIGDVRLLMVGLFPNTRHWSKVLGTH